MPFIPNIEFGDWEQFDIDILPEFSEPRLHTIYVRSHEEHQIVDAMVHGGYVKKMIAHTDIIWSRVNQPYAEQMWLIAFEVHPMDNHHMFIVLETFEPDKHDELMGYAQATGLKFGLLYE